jgi:hypothetical protein
VARRKTDRINEEKKDWKSTSFATLELFSRSDIAGYIINYSW